MINEKRRAAGFEPLDRGRPGFGVHPPVGYAFSSRREQVIELFEKLDAVVASLGQERFAGIAAERSCSPPFRLRDGSAAGSGPA
jgi:hypothetical protein